MQRLTQNDSIEDFLVASTHTMFTWKDYDDDGQEELMTKQMFYFQSSPFYAATLYSIYQIEDDVTAVKQRRFTIDLSVAVALNLTFQQINGEWKVVDITFDI